MSPIWDLILLLYLSHLEEGILVVKGLVAMATIGYLYMAFYWLALSLIAATAVVVLAAIAAAACIIWMLYMIVWCFRSGQGQRALYFIALPVTVAITGVFVRYVAQDWLIDLFGAIPEPKNGLLEIVCGLLIVAIGFLILIGTLLVPINLSVADEPQLWVLALLMANFDAAFVVCIHTAILRSMV